MRPNLVKPIYRAGLASLFSVALIASTGCGGNNNSSPSHTANSSSPAAPSVKMETVRVWTNDASYKPVLEPLVEKYNQGQGLIDGINIEYKLFGSNYDDVLKVALAAGQAPELYKFVGTVKEPFINSQWMVPIDDLPGGPEFLKTYQDILIKGYNTFNGKSYSVPYKVLTTKFMYNKELLEKSGFTTPPETWDDVVAYAKKITADNKGNAYGYGVHLKDSAASGKWYFASQFASSVGHMGYDFTKGRYSFIDLKENISKILEMKADGSIFPGGEGMDNDALMAQFSTGRIAMLPGVNWDVSNFENFKKEVGSTFELGVINTPVIDTANRHKNYAQIADVLCVGPSAKKMPEKSMKVYELFHSDEVLKAIQSDEIDFVARQDIQAQKPTSFKKAGTAEFGDTSNSYFTMTPPDGGIKIEGQPYQNTIINLIAGSTKVDVAKVLTDLDNRYNTALDKAIKDGLDMTLYIDKDWNTKSN
ncbi:ABC transporter substrate-binding protein [Cohnella abietis]|uniref:Sugar ABC transporter substrate-binding protein n=1 Tax=Cohnella abietis TaxID=2507935 RepID=A0A3T1DEL3_9BACL|nr:extracellular solute-binding protein [Cohnella abietis]BBI36596.1 hypothetical protein KCTCHS21_59950 [Cohnella abietis]